MKSNPYTYTEDENYKAEEYKSDVMAALRDDLSVTCFKRKHGSEEMVGMSTLYLKRKDQRKIEPPTKAIEDEHGTESASLKIFADAYYQITRFDVFTEYNVSKYLGSDGMAVLPGYRGRGIGEKLLRCRRKISKKHGMKVTSSIFTNEISNRVAEKAGFTKIDRSLKYVDLENVYVLSVLIV